MGRKLFFFRESPNLGQGRTPARGNDFRAGTWNDWNLPGKRCFVHSSNQSSSFFGDLPPGSSSWDCFPHPVLEASLKFGDKTAPNVDRGCGTAEVPSKSRASPPWLQRGSFRINKEEIGRFLPKEAVPGVP